MSQTAGPRRVPRLIDHRTGHGLEPLIRHRSVFIFILGIAFMSARREAVEAAETAAAAGGAAAHTARETPDDGEEDQGADDDAGDYGPSEVGFC